MPWNEIRPALSAMGAAWLLFCGGCSDKTALAVVPDPSALTGPAGGAGGGDAQGGTAGDNSGDAGTDNVEGGDVEAGWDDSLPPIEGGPSDFLHTSKTKIM